MPDDLHTVVQRMMEAGEPEANIATVIRGYGSVAPQASHAPNQISQGEWDALPAGEKMQRLLKWGGHAIAGAFMPGREGQNAVDNPITTLAGAVLPEALSPSAMTAAGRKMVDLAPRMVQAAIKPTVSQLGREAGASVTGLQPQATRLSGMLLKNRWRNATQAGAAIRSAENELQGVLQNAGDVTLDTAERVPRYLNSIERSAAKQAAPTADVSAIRRAGGDVLNGPLAEDVTSTVMKPSPSGLVDEFGKPVMAPTQETTRALRTDVTPSEGLDIARATGRWSNRKAWGELKGAEQEASKASERAVRDSVKEAVPAAKPILQKQGEALKLFPVLDRMALRQGNRDLIGLPAWIGASSGGGIARGVMGIAGQVMRNSQLPLGYAAQDAGKALMQNAGRVGTVAPNALRAALMAMLSDQPDQEQ